MQIYVVVPGDNVDEISTRYGVPSESLIYANQLVYPYQLAIGQALLQLRGLGLELGVGEGLELLLQGVHLVGDGVDGLQLPLGGGPENLGKQAHCVKHLSVVIWWFLLV